MSAKINSRYVENYASEFTQLICDQYFSNKKYMTGQDIVQLTPSSQVNFFIIKALFEAWQSELEKLKSNPYFDYRDKAVHDALKDFMNILSRTIKIERQHFEPLLAEAVAYSMVLAVDPVGYFSQEFDKIDEDQLHYYLKENKKYFKWHTGLVSNLVDRAGLGHSHKAYNSALNYNFDQQENSLDKPESLLNSLSDVLPISYSDLMNKGSKEEKKQEDPKPVEEKKIEEPKVKEEAVALSTVEVKNEPVSPPSSKGMQWEVKKDDVAVEEPLEEVIEKPRHAAASGANAIDPLKAWARYESEEYTVMKGTGTIKDLSESVALNQRFMFTKELFDGNPDLLKHALKTIDKCDSFMDAIKLINERYVGELKWDKNSEPVEEFLQLIFRKFNYRG